MASIQKIPGKRGDAYKITVSEGFDSNGKRRKRFMTYRPEPGMTARQIQKAVQRAAADFERSVEQGYTLDNKQTFAQYAEYVLGLKEHNGDLKIKTIDRYRDILLRVNQAIGHIQLADLRPQHLNSFYKNLAEDGVRADGSSATAAVDFPQLLKARKLTRAALAQAAGVSASTVTVVCRGESISAATAGAIAKALGKPTEELFTLSAKGGGLSPKTIREHHVVISSILAQAEKEMLVPYNAAEKASPPRVKHTDPNYFQPEEVARILDALDKAPLKWRTITNLLIVTGCRRGEIMGLKWDHVDMATGRVQISTALLSTKSRGVYEDTTKTEATRFLILPTATLEMLKQYRLEQKRLQIANGDRWHHTGYVFTRDDGRQMNPDSITGWLSRFSQRHDLPHINPHAFRHTVASVLLANGTDIVTVSKQLGHANVGTTENFYSHIIEENKAKASECIADVLLRKKA